MWSAFWHEFSWGFETAEHVMRQKRFDILGFPRLCLIILNKNLTFYSVNLTFYSVVKVCNNNAHIIDLHFDMNLAVLSVLLISKLLEYGMHQRVFDILGIQCLVWLFWTKNLTFYSKMISFRRIVDFHRKYLKYVDTYHVWMLQTANEVPRSTFTTLKIISVPVRNLKT